MADLFVSLVSITQGLRSAIKQGDIFTPTTKQTFSGNRRVMPAITDPSTLTTGLEGFWSLEGSSADALGVLNGTDTGVSYGSGVLGQAATLTSTTGSIDLGTSATLNLATVSISAWVKVPPAGSWSFIVTRTQGTGITNSVYELRVNLSNQVEWLGPGGLGSITPATLTANVWYHIAATRTASNNYTTYINGAVAHTTGPGGPAPSSLPTNHTQIGARDDALPHALTSIDEVGIWSKALTAGEVTELYNSGYGKAYPF